MTPNLIPLEPAVDADLAAGEFTDWLENMCRALEGRGESDVPCGDCDACCRSSYFIAVTPEDEAARRRIPAALLFDAPGAPSGHQLLGYDEAGRCPMLKSTGCDVYADRPGTCRTYDCRIFAATGIAEADPGKAEVTARATRWRFSYRDESSRHLHDLLKRGAQLLAALQETGAAVEVPSTATQLAMLTVRLNQWFQEQAPLFDRLDEPAVKKELDASALLAIRALLSDSSR